MPLFFLFHVSCFQPSAHHLFATWAFTNGFGPVPDVAWFESIQPFKCSCWALARSFNCVSYSQVKKGHFKGKWAQSKLDCETSSSALSTAPSNRSIEAVAPSNCRCFVGGFVLPLRTSYLYLPKDQMHEGRPNEGHLRGFCLGLKAK